MNDATPNDGVLHLRGLQTILYVATSGGTPEITTHSSVLTGVEGAIEAVLSAPKKKTAFLHTLDIDSDDTLQLAKQLGEEACSLVGPGHVILSLATLEIARPRLPEDVSVEEMGTLRLGVGFRAERIYALRHPTLPVPQDVAGRAAWQEHVSRFIGREDELETLRRYIAMVSAMTITGMTGVGKTALVRRLLAEIDDERDVVWARMKNAAHPSMILPCLMQAFELSHVASQSAIETLIQHIGDKQTLLVLDGCDRVAAEISEVAADLLGQCRNLQILATSQRHLHMPNELTLPLEGLSLPTQKNDVQDPMAFDSVRLFVERAREVSPRFELTSVNTSAVLRICQILGGVPLAIELAASRSNIFSPVQIVGRLNSDLDLLEGETSGKDPTHAGLRAAVGWTAALVSPAAQLLLRRLSVVQDTFTYEQACDICTDSALSQAQIAGAITELLDVGLAVTRAEFQFENHFELPGQSRLYAAEQLKKAGEQAKFIDRAKKWCHKHLELLAKGPGTDQQLWFEKIDGSYEDIRVWFRSHMSTVAGLKAALPFFFGMASYWMSRGWPADAVEFAQVGIMCPGSSKLPEYPRLVSAASVFSLEAGELVRAKGFAREALRMALARKDQFAQFAALSNLSTVAYRQLRPRASFHCARFAVSVALDGKGLGADMVVRAHCNLASAATAIGEFAFAQQSIETAMALEKELSAGALAALLHNAAHIAYTSGDYALSWQFVQRYLAVSQGAFYEAEISELGLTAARLCLAEDRYERAAEIVGGLLAASSWSNQPVSLVTVERINQVRGLVAEKMPPEAYSEYVMAGRFRDKYSFVELLAQSCTR